jgi:hypothetical protein
MLTGKLRVGLQHSIALRAIMASVDALLSRSDAIILEVQQVHLMKFTNIHQRTAITGDGEIVPHHRRHILRTSSRIPTRPM